MRMCTSCVVTTDLGVNYWPRYFTEITCHGPDTACLNFHRDPHEVSPPPIMPCKDISFEIFNNSIKIAKIPILITSYPSIVKLTCNFRKRRISSFHTPTSLQKTCISTDIDLFVIETLS